MLYRFNPFSVRARRKRTDDERFVWPILLGFNPFSVRARRKRKGARGDEAMSSHHHVSIPSPLGRVGRAEQGLRWSEGASRFNPFSVRARRKSSLLVDNPKSLLSFQSLLR